MGCCRDFAERFVMLISALMLVFSLVVLGFAAYAAANLGDEFNELDLNSPIVASAIFGGILFLFSVIGLVGACRDNNCLLFVYLIGCLVLSFAVMVSGAVIISQSGALENVEQLEELDGDLESTVKVFQLALFVQCCAQFIIDDNNLDGIVDCPTLADEEPCVQVGEAGLFVDFLEFLVDGPESTTCQLLDDFDDIDFNVLCPQDRVVFVQELSAFFEDNIRAVGIANLIAGLIMLLLTCSTCVLLWTTRQEKNKK